MVAPQFTGKYAAIRKDIYKGTIGSKFNPKGDNLAGRKFYTTERGYYNAQKKVFDERMAKLDRIESAGLPVQATLVISHGGRGAYGVQWKGKLEYNDEHGFRKFIDGDSTTGTGYDKISTAAANAMNDSAGFLKILLDARLKKKDVGHGARLLIGDPWLPYYEGGVGINSFNHTMEKVGYDVKDVSNQNTYIFIYTLKRRPATKRRA